MAGATGPLTVQGQAGAVGTLRFRLEPLGPLCVPQGSTFGETPSAFSGDQHSFLWAGLA